MGWWLFLSLPLLWPLHCASADEVTLFSSDGAAVAYVDTDDELIIYLWAGEPVGYLEATGETLHVWGFNGKHLGWFERGAVWDGSGNAACATRDAFGGVTQFEKFKSFKKFKPFKSFQEFAPFKPFLSGRFGQIPCAIHLALGRK